MKARVIAEIGQDLPETRLYSGAVAKLSRDSGPSLVVGGFTNGGEGRTAQVAILQRGRKEWTVQEGMTWQDGRESTVRNLRVWDLDGDGRDEIVVLGRSGDDSHSASANLKILGLRGDALRVLAEASWNIADYTHGYGLELADLDGDGRVELIAGGFAGRDGREFGHLRVLRWSGAELDVLASATLEDPRFASTRINGIAAGRVLPDKGLGIVTVGRCGPGKTSDEKAAPAGERGILAAWELRDGVLHERSRAELRKGSNTRLRTVRVADLDGDGRDEILVAGQYDQPGRPLLAVFGMEAGGLVLQSEAPWQDRDAAGEIKDLIVHGSGNGLRVLATGPMGTKPGRQGQVHMWSSTGSGLKLEGMAVAAMGEETRARAVVLWPSERGVELLTIGHAAGEDDGYGQLLEWSAPDLDLRPVE